VFGESLFGQDLVLGKSIIGSQVELAALAKQATLV
jgi:hypothetical protein